MAGATLVLVTLAAGQFLMMLDSSVMNVSIATVAKDVGTTRHRDPDGDHPLHAGDGGVHDHRRQDRPDHRPQARLRDRLRDLRRRVADHGARAEPRRPADRLVVPGGARRGADPARDRRPRRLQLRPPTSGRAPTAWSPRRRGRGRGRADRSAASSPPTSPGATSSPARSWSSSRSSSSPAGSRTARPERRPRLDLVGTALSALGLGADRLRRSSAPGPGASSGPSRARPNGSASRRRSG